MPGPCFVSVRTKEYSGHVATWKQWAAKFEATTWPKGVWVREGSGWSARGNKQAVLPVVNRGFPQFAWLTPLLSALGETGVGQFAADSPATERGNRVAEATLGEGQTRNWANNCWDPSTAVVCWVFVQTKGRSRREMWWLGEEVGTNQTVRAGTSKLVRSHLEG